MKIAAKKHQKGVFSPLDNGQNALNKGCAEDFAHAHHVWVVMKDVEW